MIRDHFNYLRTIVDHQRYEVIPEYNETKTVPDMSLSVRELVNRFVRQGSFGAVATLQPVFLGEKETPAFERMTEMEKIDYAKHVGQEADEALIRIKNRKAEAELQAQKDAMELELEKRLREFDEPVVVPAEDEVK